MSEIQTLNLSLVGIYIWFWQTQTVFGVWNSAALNILVGIYISDFDKLKTISLSEIQLPYLYLYMTMFGIFLYDNLKQSCKYEYCKYGL